MSCELQVILDAFAEIKETSSRLAKEKILQKLIKQGSKITSMLREILIYTYHPYYNYWVKVNNSQKCSKQNGVNADWVNFKAILDSLRSREYTGNKACEIVDDFLSNCLIDSSVAFWFSQIINRRLEIGFLLKSFEKQLGQLVPATKPMLASPWKGETFKDEVAIEPKLDGTRCFIIFDDEGNTSAITRNGLLFYNVEAIIEDIKDQFAGTTEQNGAVFDGEVCGSSWGDSTSAAHSKNKKVKGSKYFIFDLLTLEEWEKKKCKRTLEDRRDLLHEVINEDTDNIQVIRQDVYASLNESEIKQAFKNARKKGYEGIIIKPLDGVYEFKRSKNWLKKKFKQTDEFRVVGRLEGKHKNVGKLGSLIVEGKVDGVKVYSEVGQGFSDEDRESLWQLPESELKRLVIEVEHYGITSSLRKDKSSKRSALRNGVFLRIREDKEER
jgi:ATP-dependent DNA ligase